MTSPSHRVRSTDGTELAVYESGDPAAPTVLAVHGYPDNHTVWTGVADRLAARCHVVTYDVRGAGDSDKPQGRDAYRLPQLVADLAAVLDATSPDRPVHLVGHDWGSIQGWAAITDPRLAGRIATYTSISGPALDQSAAWLRDVRAHPGAVLRQLAHSYYIGVFQLPRVPEALARSGVMDRLLGERRVARSEADKINGLWLYRANMGGRPPRPRPVPADLPVQVVIPDRDRYVTPALAAGAPAPWVADLTVRRVPGGHWIVAEQPELIANLVAAIAGI